MSFRFKICVLVVAFCLALVAIICRSLIIESVETRPHLESKVVEWTRIAPPYMSPDVGMHDIRILLYYRGFGDTEFRTTAHGPLGGCFRNGFMLNGVMHPFPLPPNKEAKWCGEITLDLKEWLHPGRNTLILYTTPYSLSDYTTVSSGIAIGVPLFSHDKTQCALTLIMLASLLALFWVLLQEQGYAWPACLMFTAACIDYLLGLYCIPNFSYTIDFSRNMSYIQFVSEHFLQSFEWKGPENWNPPLYYWVCALVARVSSWIGVFDLWTGIRMISLLSYLVMIYYGMRVMALHLKGSAFYLAFGVLAFWPHGVLCSVWLHSDVMLYAFYAASFYYLTVWYETGQNSALKWALANCGFALMVKTSAAILVVIIGLTALFRLAAKTAIIRIELTSLKGLPATLCSLSAGIRSLFSSETRDGWVTVAAGFLFNQTKYLYYLTSKEATLRFTDSVNWGWGAEPMHPKYLALFDVGSLFGLYGIPGTAQPIWSTLLTSMMFALWPNREEALYLNALLLIMLAYIVVFMLTLSRERLIAFLPLLMGIIVPVTALVVYRYICRTSSCMLFRYIEPSLIAIVLVYMISVQEARKKDMPILYYGGNLIAVLFIIFSILFFQIYITA